MTENNNVNQNINIKSNSLSEEQENPNLSTPLQNKLINSNTNLFSKSQSKLKSKSLSYIDFNFSSNNNNNYNQKIKFTKLKDSLVPLSPSNASVIKIHKLKNFNNNNNSNNINKNFISVGANTNSVLCNSTKNKNKFNFSFDEEFENKKKNETNIKKMKHLKIKHNISDINNNNTNIQSSNNSNSNILLPLLNHSLSFSTRNKNSKHTKILFPLSRNSINNHINTPINNFNNNNDNLIYSPKILQTHSPKKIPDINFFHHKLMSENISACSQKIEDYYLNQKKQNEKYINSLLLEDKLDFKDKTKKTGIYGPSNNIVSVIRARMMRLKFDNEYKGVEKEIKQILIDEFMDAQVRLKRKPEKLEVDKNLKKRPLYLKKLDSQRYLAQKCQVLQINQMANVPVVIKDGSAMIKIIDDAFEVMKSGKNNLPINKEENKDDAKDNNTKKNNNKTNKGKNTNNEEKSKGRSGSKKKGRNESSNSNNSKKNKVKIQDDGSYLTIGIDRNRKSVFTKKKYIKLHSNVIKRKTNNMYDFGYESNCRSKSMV